MATTRKATQQDVISIASLAAAKRFEYESYQPLMWRRAKDADAVHRQWLSRLIDDQFHICLVHEYEDRIDGFIIGRIQPAPPVYDPGGLTCLVDDFVVENPRSWQTTGRRLLDDLSELVRRRNVSQIIVVTGHKDGPKRDMLHALSYSLASEWYTRPIESDGPRQ